MSSHISRFASLARCFPRKRAFITGAGTGLGFALAETLAEDGWILGLFDRDVEGLAAAEEELTRRGIPALAYPGDVTHQDELTVAVNSFAATYDGLDVMINNAGVAAAGALMEASLDDWRWVMDTNVMGVVHGCRAALPHLQRNGSGLILNIASTAAFVAAPSMASYNATKAAVLSISETLAAELHGGGTRVCVAMPAFFESELLEPSRGPLDLRAVAAGMMKVSGMSAAQAAREILRQAGRGHMYIVLPGRARMLWRLKRWLPAPFVRALAGLHARSSRERKLDTFDAPSQAHHETAEASRAFGEG